MGAGPKGKDKYASLTKEKAVKNDKPSKFVKKPSVFGGGGSHSISLAPVSELPLTKPASYQKSISPKNAQHAIKHEIEKADLDTDVLKPNGNIHIEVNHEDSIISYLTKDHKANMSLLFYDFNNSNQRLKQKQQAHHPGQNIADLVIPEEEGDVGDAIGGNG